MDQDELAVRLANNLKLLRESRGLTQQQIAKLAGLPRATWGNLESGAANPTLSVLAKVALALQVTTEELLAKPRVAAELYKLGSLPTRVRGQVSVRKLLPDPIPSTDFERFELPPNSSMSGVPHTPGTKEYLACELGAIHLVVSGDTWIVEAGDVVAFRGDQKHSYANKGNVSAVGYSVVVLAK